MKKMFAILVVAVMLVGCGSKLTENNTRIAKVVVNAVEGYLDGEMSASEAHDIVYGEYDRIQDGETADVLFGSKVLLISLELYHNDFDGSGDDGKIKDMCQEIKDLAGI
ncbi:hypothetical protein LJB76_02575 [Clostridia bacterium OttesenSCG-928-O13]|nr:hypothetical protein [Clostridia bacterium OttesenSCG-928-O13]